MTASWGSGGPDVAYQSSRGPSKGLHGRDAAGSSRRHEVAVVDANVAPASRITRRFAPQNHPLAMGGVEPVPG